MEFQKSFGTSVRAWRSRLGISQEELAGRAGLHRTYVCDIERGARNVSLKSIEKLARALEVSVSRLFSYAPEGGGDAAKGKVLSPEDLVNILLVEDEADDIRLASEALKAGHLANEMQVVRDGAEALDYLFCTGNYARRNPADRPHVVLLDLHLPKVDGLEVLRRMKSDPRTRSIPVIVLTASKDDHDIAVSRRLGAEAYIIKPVDLQRLSEVTPQLSLQWALLKSAPAPPAA